MKYKVGDIIYSVDNEWPDWKHKKIMIISVEHCNTIVGCQLMLMENIEGVFKSGQIFEPKYHFAHRHAILCPEYIKEAIN